MFGNKYPYTDFHELNLDWFLKEFVKLQKELEELKQTVEALDPDSITVNPDLEGDEPLLTGIQVNDDKYRAPADVTADPELDGTEPFLEALKIDEDKYKIPERVRLYGSNPPSSNLECGAIQLGNGQIYQITYVQPNPSGPVTTPLNTIRIRNNLYRILPTVSAADVGKFLRVNVSGLWAAETVPAAEGEDF